MLSFGPQRLPDRRDVGFLIGACIGVPLLVGPLVVTAPKYGIALLLGVVVIGLAARSLVYPVALNGVPALAIGLYGRDPLPGKVLFILLTIWLLVGIGLALRAGLWPRAAAARQAIAAPFLLTILYAVLLVVRMGPGTYPKTKIELFVLQDLPLLAAGILLAYRVRTFTVFLIFTLAMAVANAAVLAEQISSGQATQVFTGRFTISTNYNPIQAGREAAIGVMVAVAIVLSSRSRRTTLFSFAALPLLAISLTSAGSRGPVVALVAAILVLVALSQHDRLTRSRLLRVGVGVVVALVVVSVTVPGDAIQRSASFLFGNTSGLSSNGRSQLWDQAVNLFVSHPLTGVGTGGFAIYQPIYRYPHDIVLEAGAELGIAGLTIMVLFLVLALMTAFRVWSRSSSPEERIGAALVAALLVAAVVNSLLSDSIETTDTLWLTVGLAYGLRARLSERAARGPVMPPATIRATV